MPGFQAGRSYKVLTSTVQTLRWTAKGAITGGTEQVELSGQELAVFIVNDDGERRCFMADELMTKTIVLGDNTKIDHGFAQLLNHFNVPHVKDVAELYPDTYSNNLSRIDELQTWIRYALPRFSFADYQRDDIARGLIRDGFILAWHPGLGKTLAAFIWALCKAGWTFEPHGIRPSKPVLIVALGDLHDQFDSEARKYLGARTRRIESKHDYLRMKAGMPLKPGFYAVSYSRLVQCGILDECRNDFDIVIVDEGTKLKSDTAAIAEGLRSLNPRSRLVATATPMKNRVPDLYWLLHWVAGGRPEPHPGFPFAGLPDKERFQLLHLVTERNLSREKRKREAGKPRKQIRFTARACNLHRLWTITAPLIMRRRKSDVADMVKKIQHRVYVPLGKEQRQVYALHLAHDYLDRRDRPAFGAKLTKLRQVAACPNSATLLFRTKTDYVPKTAAVLSIIAEVLRRREQVIVFNAFTEGSDVISRRLYDAGVRHLVADGRISQKRRAALCEEFKKGRPPVLLAGEASMSFGHSFSLCSNVIIPSKDWAMDIDLQAGDRAHRFDSVKDLNIWSIACRGTIDERVENLHDEKKMSDSMILDAEVSEQPDEVNLSDFLTQVIHDFDSNQDLPVDEQQLEADWPKLRDELRQAANLV